MFYNVVGLAFVSCFICAVVNAIDDFNSMREALRWATQSLTLRSRSRSKTSSFGTELQECGRSDSKSESNGNQPDTNHLGGISTRDVKFPNPDTWHDNKGLNNNE